MLLRTLEKSILNDFTYYEIILFADANKNGSAYPKAYKTERNARKAAESLFNTGNYQIIVLRKEEVIKQVPHVTYYAINSVVKTYTRK